MGTGAAWRSSTAVLLVRYPVEGDAGSMATGAASRSSTAVLFFILFYFFSIFIFRFSFFDFYFSIFILRYPVEGDAGSMVTGAAWH